MQINALERQTSNLKATFEADSQEKYAAFKDHFNSRVLAIQKEFVDHMNDVLGQTPGSGTGHQRQEGEEFVPSCAEDRTFGIRYSNK